MIYWGYRVDDKNTQKEKKTISRSISTSHNTNRDLYTFLPLLSTTTKSTPITQFFSHNTTPQSPHHPLPSPSRQTQNLIVPQISSHVKLKCHNERFIRSVLFVQHRRGIELPKMRCGKVKNIRMTLDLIIYNHRFIMFYEKCWEGGREMPTSRITRRNNSILPLESPRTGEVCKSTVPNTVHARYETLNVTSAIKDARIRSAGRCCVLYVTIPIKFSLFEWKRGKEKLTEVRIQQCRTWLNRIGVGLRCMDSIVN